MENHHFIAGKIHYFDWAIFNSKLLVYQRVVYIISFTLFHGHLMRPHFQTTLNNPTEVNGKLAMVENGPCF